MTPDDPTPTRAQQLRERHRKIVRRSLVAAVGLHGIVFFLFFTRDIPVRPLAGGESEDPLEAPIDAPVFLEARFGPPRITGPDGTVRDEPGDRTLEVHRAVQRPPTCASARVGTIAYGGSVRLRVVHSGRVDVLAVADSTGDACGDDLMRALAGDLEYRWLPDERFPAPVELIQPVVLREEPVGG